MIISLSKSVSLYGTLSIAPIFLGIGHNTFIDCDDVIDNGLRQVRIPVGITDKRCIIFKMIALDSILSKDDS